MPDEKQVSFADSVPGDVAQIMQTINSQELYNLFEYNRLRSNEQTKATNQIDVLGVNVMEHALNLIKSRYTGFDYNTLTKSNQMSIGNLMGLLSNGNVLRNFYDWNRSDSLNFSNRQYPDAVFMLTLTLNHVRKTFLICYESDGDSKSNQSRTVAMKMWQNTDLCRLVNEDVPAFTVRSNLTRWRTDLKSKLEHRRENGFRATKDELKRFYNDVYSIKGQKWSDLDDQMKREFEMYHEEISQLNLTKNIIYGFLTNLCRSLVAVAWDAARIAAKLPPRLLNVVGTRKIDMHIFVGSFKFAGMESNHEDHKGIESTDWTKYETVENIPDEVKKKYPRQTRNTAYPNNKTIDWTLQDESNITWNRYRCKSLFLENHQLLSQWKDWKWSYNFKKVKGEDVMPDASFSALDIQVLAVERLNYKSESDFSGMWYVSDLKQFLGTLPRDQKSAKVSELCNLLNLKDETNQVFNFEDLKDPFHDAFSLGSKDYEERYNQPWYRLFVEPFMNVMENQMLTLTKDVKWIQENRRELDMIDTFKIIKNPKYYFSVRRQDLEDDTEVLTDGVKNLSLTRSCLNSLSKTLPSEGANARELKLYLQQFHVPYAFTFFRMMGCTNVLSLQEMARRCFSETEFRERLNRKLDMLPLGMQTEVLFVLSYCREHIFLPTQNPSQFQDFLDSRANGDEKKDEVEDEIAETADEDIPKNNRTQPNKDDTDNDKEDQNKKTQIENNEIDEEIHPTDGWQLVTKEDADALNTEKKEFFTYDVAKTLSEKYHLWWWNHHGQFGLNKGWILFDIMNHTDKTKVTENHVELREIITNEAAKKKRRQKLREIELQLEWIDYFVDSTDGKWALEKKIL